MTTLAFQTGRIDGAVGDILSSDAITQACKLSVNAPAPKIKKLRRHLRKAGQLLQQDNYSEAGKEALHALDISQTNGLANHIAAIAMDRMDQMELALSLYSRALKDEPENPEIYRNVGLLAWRMEKYEFAETFFRSQIKLAPDSWDALNNLGCVLRDKGLLSDSMELLRAALYQFPEESDLWTSIGSTAALQKMTSQAIEFHSEAVRLAPDNAKAQHNLGFTILTDGNPEDALAPLDRAIKLHKPNSTDMIASLHARSHALLSSGQLEEGWKQYDIRLDPKYDDSIDFLMSIPKWADEDITGKKLLLVGEQGLGDEVLFSTLIEDAKSLVGPDGELGIACEQRLAPLFQRTFPDLEILSHRSGKTNNRTRRVIHERSGGEGYDVWAPLGAPLKHLRNSIESFQTPPKPLLKPDEERVSHWQSELAKLPAGRKVGILWKSGIMTVKRSRHFSEFENWAPILKTPGITWINLQYGGSESEMRYAKDKMGIDIHTLPDIDLKQDLDDICALTKALDMVIGPMNATTNLAAAAGTPFWLLWPATAWTHLGTDTMPWYPNTRVFSPKTISNWTPAIKNLATALAQDIENPDNQAAA